MGMIRKIILIVGLAVFLFLVGRGGPQITEVHVAAAPYSYSLLKWEAVHLPIKGLHKIRDVVTRANYSRDEQSAVILEYFMIDEKIGQRKRFSGEERYLHSTGLQGGRIESQALDKLISRQQDLKPRMEEGIESEVSSVLTEEGLNFWKGFIFPPVDVVFTGTPMLLVISPRDRIELTETILLRTDITVEQIESLENTIFQKEGLSALVVGISGLATYPSMVSPKHGLLNATRITIHEWLHQFLFFRTLGRNYWRSPEMTTLNETVATLASDELADRIYEAITSIQPSKLTKKEVPNTAFNFREEMRSTRTRVDRLLAVEQITEAEAYMEIRRQLFANNGYEMRKLNQAYFAFHGVYADNPASTSPIHDELVRFRTATDSVGDFIREVSRFGTYQEFKAALERSTYGHTDVP